MVTMRAYLERCKIDCFYKLLVNDKRQENRSWSVMMKKMIKTAVCYAVVLSETDRFEREEVI